MSTIHDAMIVADEIADRYGDHERYRLKFIEARQYNGIMASIRLALLEQNLWDFFEARCTPEVLSRYF
jgi:hypothetical protein